MVQARRVGFISGLDKISSIAGLVQTAISNWPTISAYAGGGALMGVLAYMQALPPLAWGGAFFGGLFLTAFVRAVVRWGRSREALARLYDATASQPTSFNRLQNEFAKATIKIADLVHPIGEPLVGKTFIDCEFHGPGLLALSGCSFDGFIGGNVELVRLPNSVGSSMPNKAIMFNCHLVRCRYYNVALAMTSESVDALRMALNNNIPVMGE